MSVPEEISANPVDPAAVVPEPTGEGDPASSSGAPVEVSPPSGFRLFTVKKPGGEAKPPNFVPLLATIDETTGESIFAEAPPPDLVRNVAPIGADHRGSHHNFILGQMIKEQVIPKFSGEVCDFEQFRWLFSRYLTKLEQTQGHPLEEDMKIFIPEKALPQYESRWLQQMQQEGHPITCQGFLAKMEAKFGATRDCQIRQKWENLKCTHDGKMTAMVMQKFELEFRQLRKELPTISDEEVHRHLMKRLPPTWSIG